jgi:hypothetical protein
VLGKDVVGIGVLSSNDFSSKFTDVGLASSSHSNQEDRVIRSLGG